MKASDSLFLHRVLNGIADSTIKIFIPILIYNFTGSLPYVFLYVTCNFFVCSVLFFAMRRFLRRFSILSMIIHIVPIIVVCVLLKTAEMNIYIILLLALLDGLGTVMYYGGLNLIFASLETSNNVAKFEAGNFTGKIICAIMSAYVLGELKDSLIYIVIFASVMYIFSIIPLLSSYKKLTSNYKNSRKFSEWKINKYNKSFNFYHCFTGLFSCCIDIVLPLYLMLKGLSFSAVGIMVACSYALQIIAGYLSKFLENKSLSKYNIAFSSASFFICLMVILILNNPVAIYILSLVMSFAYQMIFDVMYAKFNKVCKDTGTYYQEILQRDIYQNLTRCVFSSIYFVFSNFLFFFGVGIASSIAIGVSGIKALNFANGEMKNGYPIAKKFHFLEDDSEVKE